MKNKKISFLVAFLLLFMVNSVGYAQTILYVPFDNRPVSLDYVTDTVAKGGYEILVPPEEHLASRTKSANPYALWEWVFENAKQADAVVVSADALIYGGLVSSRTHSLSEEVLINRTANFEKLKEANPSLRLYVFSTIMRSPHASSGGVEPLYYETYGPDIFRFTALQDKGEIQTLTQQEQEELMILKSTLPVEVITDWLDRREKNFKVNTQLINGAKQDLFSYLLMGRDDCSPYSRSHQESRWLSKETVGLPASKYLSFPGADQLGMVLLARAVNDLAFKLPSVTVKYTSGVGEHTIPSYEDTQVGKTVRDHLVAAGCVILQSEALADMILAVNTPVDGWTREAGMVFNTAEASHSTVDFANKVEKDIAAGKKVAVADIAFANGADNAFMHEMAARKILPKLEAYSGWNTASNTIGYTIGQAIFAQNMTKENKNKLIAVRLIDDWAYQANVRSTVMEEVLYPQGGSNVQLDEMLPKITAETQQRIVVFANKNFKGFPINGPQVTFPWNRMFEIKATVKN